MNTRLNALGLAVAQTRLTLQALSPLVAKYRGATLYDPDGPHQSHAQMTPGA